MSRALSRAEFNDLRRVVHDAFMDLDESVLTLRRQSDAQEKHPQFGHPLPSAEKIDVFELHYTTVLSSYLKELGPERADFSTKPRFLVYLSSIEVERVLPDGRIHRESDVILINNVEHEIDAVVPYPQLHGKSCVIKLRLTNRSPAEQDQGDNGEQDA